MTKPGGKLGFSGSKEPCVKVKSGQLWKETGRGVCGEVSDKGGVAKGD